MTVPDAAKSEVDAVPAAGRSSVDAQLFPNGPPETEEDKDRLFELYKIMVTSSENLVNRRQGVNTFFLTINGAVVTAAGLILSLKSHGRVEASGLLVLTVTGAILALAWRSLIRSFGQLNTGKFAVINRIEEEFPAAIYAAEWKALDEGTNPKKYRTFTSREIWVPNAFFVLNSAAAVASLVVLIF